jgi:two-component system, chemotaxis family, chemotaxis protein CheY
MSQAGGARILAVDDSPTMRALLQRVLTDAGHQVLMAADACEALARLQAEAVDLILTDVNMPRMDVVSFVRALRADPRFAHTPILVVTTEAEAEAKAAGRGAGATGWIVKPFHPEQLCEVIRVVLDRTPRPTADSQREP